MFAVTCTRAIVPTVDPSTCPRGHNRRRATRTGRTGLITSIEGSSEVRGTSPGEPSEASPGVSLPLRPCPLFRCTRKNIQRRIAFRRLTYEYAASAHAYPFDPPPSRGARTTARIRPTAETLTDSHDLSASVSFLAFPSGRSLSFQGSCCQRPKALSASKRPY